MPGGLFSRRRRRRGRDEYHPHNVHLDDILPHLKTTVSITGAFCTAWAWDLVYYGGSHAAARENPLHNQLGFAQQQRAPQHLMVLLLQYLLVCAAAAVASDWVEQRHARWSQAAITAIEFFPSPVFAGKLMAYLTTISKLDTVESAWINLAATWFAATLAHVVPLFTAHGDGIPATWIERLRLQKFGTIVQATLGFGLGIAWNVFLGNLLGPRQDDGSTPQDLDLFRLIGLGGYLAVVTLISFRLAATAPSDNPTTSSIWDRQWVLLEFAAYVVNAFTLVQFLNALLHDGWLGHFEGLWLLLGLSAGMSALVARADLEGSEESTATGTSISNENDDNDPCKLQEGPFGFMFGILLFVPCVWCCCPWVPVLWLLTGTETALGVKEHWYKLIAMVAGLASSIEASGMITDVTNLLASPFCTIKYCSLPWLFVLLQTVLAFVVTIVLIPVISMLEPQEPTRSNERLPTAEGTASKGDRDETQPADEKKPLLKKVRDKLKRSKNEPNAEQQQRESVQV